MVYFIYTKYWTSIGHALLFDNREWALFPEVHMHIPSNIGMYNRIYMTSGPDIASLNVD